MSTVESTERLIGFLTAIELAEIGWCGGLLVLNDRGRPIEFHCNSPIRANRTQQILYGAAWRPLVLAESIGLALIEKGGGKAAVILSDLPELGAIAARLENLLVGVWAGQVEDHRSAAFPASRWTLSEVEGQAFHVPVSRAGQANEIQTVLTPFAQRLPLSEPFERIRQAITEAHSAAQYRESA